MPNCSQLFLVLHFEYLKLNTWDLEADILISVAVLCLSISIKFNRIIHSGTEGDSVMVISKNQEFTVEQLQDIVH